MRQNRTDYISAEESRKRQARIDSDALRGTNGTVADLCRIVRVADSGPKIECGCADGDFKSDASKARMEARARRGDSLEVDRDDPENKNLRSFDAQDEMRARNESAYKTAGTKRTDLGNGITRSPGGGLHKDRSGVRR